jgi:multimeric flavodoxin WrbA
MILLLNGSPNKKGNTMSLVQYMLENIDYKQINLYKKNITSCNDCKYCDHKIGCKHKDDMQEIYDLLYEADTLIIASPIYFGALTDKMMQVINRFQRFYSQKFVIKEGTIPTFKNLILISTQASDKLYMFDGAKATIRILEKLFEPNNTEILLIPESDDLLPLNEEIKNKLNHIKQKLN